MPANRLMIVDDHPLFRDALSQALETIGDETSISDVGSLDELNAALDKDTNVDLILLDLSMIDRS
ncbi:MAG: response regulator, partial [Pseudomonadota bacterium]